MALRVREPRCLEFRRTSSRATTASDFWTTSSASVRISSMWQGLDMYGLI